MKISRRRLLAMVPGAALIGSANSQERATWPLKPVRVVVPAAPGGGLDIQLRLLEAEMGLRWGQPVYAEYRTGAGQLIGLSYLAKSPADGYTLGIASASTMALYAATGKDVPFDPFSDFWGALISSFPTILCASPKSRVKGWSEYLKLGKGASGMLTYATAGVDSTGHLAGRMLAFVSGTQLVHVPYRGAGAAQGDVAEGRVDLTIESLAASSSRIRSGALIPLAVMGTRRSPLLPGIPAVSELLREFEVDFDISTAILFPRGTPQETATLINANLRSVIRSESMRPVFEQSGITPIGSTLAEYDAYMKDSHRRFVQIIARLPKS